MDVQLKELIEKIKDEGVKSAEEKAAQIIHGAEQKAGDILAGAHKEASGIIANARAESARLDHSGREALKQAGRDLILSLKSRLEELFKTVIETGVKESLPGQVLEEAIIKLITSWSAKKVADLQVLLSPQDLEKVEKTLRSKLASELKKGLEIRPIPEIAAGFRVSMKDGSAYYNFSDQGIAEILTEYLNPRLSELILEAIAGPEKEN